MQNSIDHSWADAILIGGIRKGILLIMTTTHPSRKFEIKDERRSGLPQKRMAFAVLGSMVMAAGTAGAGERSVGPADVDAVQIEGLRGSITVKIGDSTAVDVAIAGDDEALDDVETEVVDGVLRLKLPSGGSTIVTNDGDITVVTSGGGSSTVQIGDQTFTGDDDALTFDVTATVPKGTAIRLAGMVGEVDIADTEADVALGCSSCKAKLGTIAALDVALNGSGEVAVDQIAGSLIANISGGGDIAISGGEVETAKLDIVGSGDIDFGGRAVDAAVSIVGAGKVRIRDVDHPIQQSIVGSGEVVTGQ